MVQTLDDVVESGGRVVVLQGGAGSGKSSVVRTVQEELSVPVEVLVGAGWAREVPYALLRQLRGIAAAHRPEPGGNTISDRLDIAEKLLADLPSEKDECCVIVLDDVHLADQESLQVFSQLGRGLRNTRALLLVAFDPSASPDLDPDFVRMLTDPGTVRADTGDFGQQDALELARSHGMHDIGDHGAAALAAYSGGRLSVAQEILARLPEGRWPADPGDLPLPQSVVREVLDPIQRADSEDLRQVTAALAVLEEAQDLTRVARVAGLDDLREAVDLGVGCGVLREHNSTGSTTLRLTHPAAVRVINADTLPSARRLLHNRAADSAPEAEERLVHLASASPGTDAELAQTLSEAAAAVERQGRWEDAAQLHFGSAKVLPDSVDRDTELLAGIDALASAGQVTEVLPWLEVGKSISPSIRRDTVLANVAVHRGQAAQVDDLLTRAAAVGSDDDDLNAQIAMRRTLDSLLRWDGPKICQWAAEAMDLSDFGEPAHVESRAIRGLGFAAQGKIVEAEEVIRDVAGHTVGGAQNQRFRLCAGWVALLAGSLRDAARELEAAVPTQHARGSLRISLWARGWLARVQYLLGEWDDALRTAEEGLRQCHRAGISLVAPLLHWTVAEIRLWRGHPVDEVMRRTEGGAFLSDYLVMQVPARCARAIASNVRGDHDGCAAALLPLLDADPWTAQRVSFWPWYSELVHALIAVGHDERAQQAAEQFRENSRGANNYVRALAETASAKVKQAQGNIAEAEKQFAGAVELLNDGQHPTTLARVLLSRGQMLRRANRRRDAVGSFIRAREFYEGVGATVLVNRCDQELRATGMSWRGMTDLDQFRSATEGQGNVNLTPQEQSVADLVVQGMTNAEVAQKLFIAEKTVQYHLTHIYGKFAVRSRTELAAVHRADSSPML